MNSKLLGALLLIVIIIGGYFLLTMPDQRTGTQKVGDAIHELDKGPTAAGRQLEDRTPGQKLGDSIKDAGDSVKNSTSADHN